MNKFLNLFRNKHFYINLIIILIIYSFFIYSIYPKISVTPIKDFFTSFVMVNYGSIFYMAFYIIGENYFLMILNPILLILLLAFYTNYYKKTKRLYMTYIWSILIGIGGIFTLFYCFPQIYA